jgi:PAS domain S-box-containing protein
MENNYSIFEEIVEKYNSFNPLNDFTSSPKFFKMVIEQSNDAIIILNKKGQVYFWNNSAENLCGFSKDDILGEALDVFPNQKLLPEILSKLENGEDLIGFETKLIHKSKKLKDVSLTANNIKDDNDNFIGFSFLCRDISARKHAEDDLKRSEERYALAQAVANIGSWDWDIYANELTWSDTIEPMFGFRSGEFKKTYEAFLDCVHPDDREFVVSSVNACIEDREDYNIEHRIIWPDGTIRTVSENGNVIRDESGKPLRMLGIVKDITNRKDMEKRQILTIELLECLNLATDNEMVIKDMLHLIKNFYNFDAVGIRLKKGHDYPYFVTNGFSEEFVELERDLCTQDENGEIIFDSSGRPLLECMCGNVIVGRTDPSKPFFTIGGSFWTNSTTELLANTTEEDRQAETRNRCNTEGYESVALIPICSGNEIVGLLQLNDQKTNRFSLDMIEFFEDIASSIGIAFSRLQNNN